MAAICRTSELTVSSMLKGVPTGIDDLPLSDIGLQGWNVLRQDLPFPLAVLRQSALRHNADWMRRFLRLSGALFSPHGKTTMSPQLFEQQLADGAWGITLATASQVMVARRFGIPRILLANELVGAASIRAIVEELERDPDFDFYCLVDSVEGVQILDVALQQSGCRRPLQVLVEIGVAGKRCGCRDLETALQVAQAVSRAEHLVLRGVEGFEGVINSASPEESDRLVRAFLQQLVSVAERFAVEGLFEEGPILLSAGGTQYFDLVAEVLSRAPLGGRAQVIVRSGCYLTHDSQICERLHQQLRERCPEARDLGAGLLPALEVWGVVLSRPEPTRVVVSLGKRDCSFDADLPLPVKWFRSGLHTAPAPLAGHRTAMLHDQHAMLEVPGDSPLQVGDLVACGISHPCTTFDRWQFIPIVDDEYQVTGGIRCFF